MNVWTDTQRRTWQRTLATCAKLAPLVAKLQRMAPYMPWAAELLKDINVRYEWCKMAAEIAVAADDPLDQQPP